jgi:hypothetical protein
MASRYCSLPVVHAWNDLIYIPDIMARAMDHTKVTKMGLIKSFFELMKDPNTIQCILDVPLAQVSLPDCLR